MMRLMFPARGPLLMILFPFTNNDSPYDKPVNPVIKPMIQDEMGWDRVKRIFRLTCVFFHIEIKNETPVLSLYLKFVY